MARPLRYAMAVLMLAAFSVPAFALAGDVPAHIPGFRGKVAPATGVRRPPGFPKVAPPHFPALPATNPVARAPSGARQTGRDDPGDEADDTPMRDVMDTKWKEYEPVEGQQPRSGHH